MRNCILQFFIVAASVLIYHFGFEFICLFYLLLTTFSRELCFQLLELRMRGVTWNRFPMKNLTCRDSVWIASDFYFPKLCLQQLGQRCTKTAQRLRSDDWASCDCPERKTETGQHIYMSRTKMKVISIFESKQQLQMEVTHHRIPTAGEPGFYGSYLHLLGKQIKPINIGNPKQQQKGK